MARKGGLGKGLDNLIPFGNEIENITKPVKTAKEENIAEHGITEININKVEPNREQPRKNFEEQSLTELADSIKKHGIIQPLVVQKKDDYYEIIAGERRWRASKIAGLKTVPVVIKDYTEQEIVEIALIENIQRQDLNPVEEAKAFKRLITEYNLKQEELEKKKKKSRTAVSNSMRLLKLPEEILEMVINNELSNGHARALLSIQDKEMQVKIANLAIQKGLSVREIEQMVKDLASKKKKTPKEPTQKEIVYKDIENKIKEIVGTKVKINRKNDGKGKIEIEFYSDDELDRIYDLFLNTRG